MDGNIYVPVLKATTIRNYWDGFKRIQPLIGDRRVIDIKSNNILSALYVLKENGYAPATIKQTFTILKVMFSMAYRVRAVLYNPCEGMRAPTERTHQEIIEREESQNLEKDVQRFLDVCRHTRYYELFLYPVQNRTPNWRGLCSGVEGCRSRKKMYLY